MPRRPATTLLGVVLLFSSFLSSQTPVPVAGTRVEILPVDQIRPGMKGVGYSVFQGTQPEPFPVEILGIWKNVWGPKQHIILARLGDRVLKTGVAAGMSGSPVYVDGKLIGAVSLRIGMFQNEPIAGLTPAELMLEINEMDPSRGPAQQVALGKLALPEEVKGLLNPSLALPAGVPTTETFLVPIETPLAFTGFHDAVLQQFADTFRQMGLMPVQGGAGSSISDARPVTDPEKLKAALPPGAPISGVLLAGDLSLAASGTVTYNDGRRVLAFGHPFFNFGKVEIPMATAEVVTTLGSSFLPFKILNTNEVVGVLRQDRHSGILGVLGEAAAMIPVEATVRSGGVTKTYRYELFQNPKLTPFILMLATFNTLYGVNDYGDDTTYKVRAGIELKGYPEVKLQNLYAPPDNVPVPGPMGLSFWLMERFGRIYTNSFEAPQVQRIKLSIDVIPERRTATIEHVWMEKNEVRPGEELALRVFLRPYRGQRVTKDLKVRIPATAPKGELRIQLSDADYVNRYNTYILQMNRAPGLNEIIALLNRERANGQLYITLLQPSPTAFFEDKILPSLPSSVASVIDAGRAQNRLTMMAESALQQESIPVDYVITGSQTVSVTVK